jgi:hypothetical protein
MKAPNSRWVENTAIGAWSLEFIWSLELGVWSFKA